MLPYKLDSENEFCLLSDILGDCLVMPISLGKNNFALKRNKDNTIKQYRKRINGVASSCQIVVMLYKGDMTDFTSVQIWSDIVLPEFERQQNAKAASNLADTPNNDTLPIEGNLERNKATVVNPMGNVGIYDCPNCGIVGIYDLVQCGDSWYCKSCDSYVVCFLGDFWDNVVPIPF